MIEVLSILETARSETSDQLNYLRNEPDESRCIFYKHEGCSPAKAKFKICAKCHRCKALTIENAIPALFNRIVALAGLLIATFGLGTGTGAGASMGGGSGGGGGGGK